MKKKDTPTKHVKPHDAFFKESFSMVAVAKEYIEHFLPKAIVSKLDLTELTLDNAASFRYELTDLSGYSPEKILQTQTGLLINAFLALQFGNNFDFVRENFRLFFHDENSSLNEDSNRNFVQKIDIHLQ